METIPGVLFATANSIYDIRTRYLRTCNAVAKRGLIDFSRARHIGVSRSGGTGTLVLNLSKRYASVAAFKLRPPYRPRKRHRYPLGGQDSFGKDKYLTFLQQISHAPATNISHSYNKYLTLLQQISHAPAKNISRSCNKYLTLLQQISHAPATNISRSYNKYLTLLQQIKPQFLGHPVHSPVIAPSTLMLTGVKKHSRQNIAPTVFYIQSG
jgi:hypothetical protein